MTRLVLLAAWFALAVAAGAALRLVRLDNRPMHGDEAVQAVKFGRLLERGESVYDPQEHHGPTLNYATLPIVRLAGARSLADVTETQLRLTPALFGLAAIALVWGLRRELGAAGAGWAAALTAVSPAAVFYSRYYIHETLLAAFTLLLLVAFWRGLAAGRGKAAWAWALVGGAAAGLMHATKETCVLAWAAAGLGALAAQPWLRLGGRRLGLLVLGAGCSAAAVSAMLFSGFGRRPQAVWDSFAAYAHYGARAGGEGSAGPHVHPWFYYLDVLFLHRSPDGRVWGEWPTAALAAIGLAAVLLRRGLGRKPWPAGRFFAAYAVALLAAYSAIPYKTPWCGLGPLQAATLLAGLGADVLWRAARGGWKLAAAAGLAAAVAWSSWQAGRAAFPACDDPANPYVYAHTTSDMAELGRRIEQLAARAPEGLATPVQVICPDNDYWPLPWYLRRLERTGWLDRIPRGSPAPLIIVSPRLEPALAEQLYARPGSAVAGLYVPLERRPGQIAWRLRHDTPVHVYARLRWLESLPVDAERGGHARGT